MDKEESHQGYDSTREGDKRAVCVETLKGIMGKRDGKLEFL